MKGKPGSMASQTLPSRVNRGLINRIYVRYRNYLQRSRGTTRLASAAIGALSLAGAVGGAVLPDVASAVKWPKNQRAFNCVEGNLPGASMQTFWQSSPDTLYMNVQLQRTDNKGSGPNKCAKYFYRKVFVQIEEENPNGKGISPISARLAFKGNTEIIKMDYPVTIQPHSQTCLDNGQEPRYVVSTKQNLVGLRGQRSYTDTETGPYISGNRPGDNCSPNSSDFYVTEKSTGVHNYKPKQ